MTLWILNSHQKRTSYLRIGWFFNLLTFCYYAFPLTYIKLFPSNAAHILNQDFPDSFIDKLALILVICQLSFFLGEMLTARTKSNKSLFIKLKPVKSKYLYVLLLFGLVSFFYRWSLVGGYINILQANRVDVINDVAANASIFMRYDIVFNIVSLLLAVNMALLKDYVKTNFPLFAIYLLFLIMLILMGTRLPLVNYLVGFFATFFYLNKAALKKHKKKVIIFSSVFSFLLIAYQAIRVDVRKYFLTNNFNVDWQNVSLVPMEFFTSIFAEYNLTRGMTNKPSYSYFSRLVPNSISSMLGLKNSAGYATEIADKSLYSSGNAVFTVPYASDVFHGSGDNFLLFLIISTGIYLFFSSLLGYLKKKNVLFMLTLYFLIYNVFRVEGSIWFSKLYLTYFILTAVVILLGKRLYKI